MGGIQWVPILGKDEAIGIGFRLLPEIAARIVETLPSSCYAIVTDTILAGLHLSALQQALEQQISQQSNKQKTRVVVHCVQPGEGSKSRNGKAQVEDFLLNERCTRDTVLIALGGGVVGDLSGFVAATFMRGIKYVQIPTTLLAMVDSAVGGKTAIDVPAGKNLIGAFHQPEYTFIDLSYLETLPEREFANGMAEVIKTAAIWDLEAFDTLESGVEEIKSAVLNPSTDRSSPNLNKGQELLLSVVKSSVSVKAYIVTKDEKETGLRNLVNFGHTIGHAIEAVLTPQLLHGEAVSVGMILEAEVSRALGILRNSAVGRLTRCLKAYNLPVALDEAKLAACPNFHNLSTGRLMEIMRLDKKNSGATKKIVLLAKIGKTHEEKATGVQDSVIEDILASCVQVFPGPPSKTEVQITTPGSKSISNRALILAALGEGVCRITNLLHSDDTQVMITALERLQGAKFTWEDDGETLVVQGGAGKLHPPQTSDAIYLGNAGTAARFLTTVCTLAQTQQSGSASTIITGNKRMQERPIGPLVDALQTNGADIKFQSSEGCLPLQIGATGLKGGHIKLSASISSQYVSSILLAAPYASEEVLLDLVGGEVISQPYIDMTCAMMADFGVNVERLREQGGEHTNQYRVPKAIYKNPENYAIESDASSATYPLALAAINGTTCTLANIGSSSLQGDAKFAKSVLEAMGCTVTQTRSSTTVKGPPVGQLKPLGVIDMERMTDAFMTAAVLAAVASNSSQNGAKSTQMTGISNQRVKECNRIAAMMAELAKFGVKTKEHSDGLEIFGISPSELKSGARLHCYDDHRIAMSLSVLSTVTGGPGAVITERRCVAKTWPSWWDNLTRQMGYRANGVDVDSAGPSTLPRGSDPDASIILIGMRGSGKSFVGKIAADVLDRQFIDADHYFEEKSGMSPREFVHANDWPTFRKKELAYFRDILQNNGKNHVLAMGGGIVETPEALELLKAYTGPVVDIVRDIDEVISYLDNESARPKYGEPIQDVAKRRAPLFKSCSNYEFVSHTGHRQYTNTLNQTAHDLDSVQTVRSIARFFNFITHRNLNLVDVSPSAPKRTYFLSLTFPDMTEAIDKLASITNGVDAVEIRVDLLQDPKQSPPGVLYVGQQLAILRKYTQLPVVYTIRTVSQGGKFPDNAHEEYAKLVKAGLRWGCEYIDLEISQPSGIIRDILANKGSSQIVASNHDWSGSEKWDSVGMQQTYDRAASIGDIVKIVCTATSIQDNFAMMAFRAAQTSKPLISMNMGEQGQLSRVLNPVLSPVTHALLAAAAPGQLSFADVQKALHLVGQLPKRLFCLFGTPIAHSKSPLIHNTAFQTLGLPHNYGLHETKTVDQSVREVINSPLFGGASVTIPHKLEIIPLLDRLTPEGEAIGAINTIFLEQSNGKRQLVGTNTDWIGIRDVCLKSFTPEHNRYATDACALVLGAGGTSRAAIYSLHAMGFKKIILYNRTLENAKRVAAAFPSLDIQVTDSLADLQPAVVLSTVPSEGTSTKERPNPTAGIHIPDSLLSRPQGGVVVDMSYKPRRTPLVRLAERKTGWVAVPGIDVLLHQAYEQFRLWTGRGEFLNFQFQKKVDKFEECPKEIVAETVMAAYTAEQGVER